MKATADNETPIPGYLLPEISSILFVEPACSEGEIFNTTVYGDYVCVCVGVHSCVRLNLAGP